MRAAFSRRVLASLGAVLAAASVWAAAEGDFAHRPAAMVRAGRVADERPSLVDFRSAADWLLKFTNCVARAEWSSARAIYGDGALQFSYRAVPGKGRAWARLAFPQPVVIPEGADTISFWVWGNNVYGRPADTGSVTLQGLFENPDGSRMTYMLMLVQHARWMKGYFKLDGELGRWLRPGAKLTGLGVYDMTNREERFICLDWLSIYRDEPGALALAPRPQRGVRLFADAPQGANVGAGQLPFPTTPRTVLPPARQPNPKIDFRLPTSAADFDTLAFRYDGGEWIGLAAGGGVFPAAARDARVRFFRDGDSVVCDIERAEPGVEEVRFGAVAHPAATRVAIPYWSYNEKAWTNRPCVVRMPLAGKTLFVSATPDWTQSNATELFAGRTDGAANGGVRYRPKTDGARNGCYERFVWTVSEDFAAVLPTIPNPPSPWKAVTGSVAWHALYESRPAYMRDHWYGAVRRGIRHVFASDYGAWWGDNRDTAIPFGEGPGWMPTIVPESKGGDAAYRDYVRSLADLGVRYGLYNDYTDMSTYQAEWSEDRVSRNPDGSLQLAWPGAYAPKPVWAAAACGEIPPRAQAKFRFGGGYCDVHTCVAPWERVDYDARVPGAGTFAQTYYAFGEILLAQRAAWEGPVYSEGGMHWLYAGLSDGSYAQDQSYDLPRHPWLVDFDLLRIHPLECDFGMGHNLDMFYAKGVPGGVAKGQAIDRFLAATAAFGHPPYLIVNWTNGARSYFLLQALAKRYTQSAAEVIAYADGEGRWWPTSEAVANGAYVRSQVRVRYADGTVIVANGSTNETLTATCGDRAVTLPPNAFCGVSGDGKAEATMGLVDGRRVEWASSEEYRYVNARGTFTVFPDGTATDGIVVRLPADARCVAGQPGAWHEEVIPTGATRVELPYAARRVQALDYRRQPVDGGAFEVKDDRTLLTPSDRVVSWLIER